ncbi:uncharacterized protein RHOBADRAFT_52750 [Rhodotorula graminis WP1]|uniref:histone deacetylase n=1 Tax=Rhodotorula graminis (strain WP1) TaxID=578459 RepID=A0A194S8I4_RHOGW|nr:uncharacterized protein RHOBADRAFT_52750 [Rhodotorula graminis WP1]KPV75716.1 hypothetical protein RHOBADRAFT_52750 [Rhodotorula graminis WP1]
MVALHPPPPFSMNHPAFSSAAFLQGPSTSTVVQEYGVESAAGGNGDASAAQLEGESWRGGFSGGSAVGVHSAPRVSYYFPQGERHPMKPHRLTLTNHLVLGYGLHKRMDVFQPRSATKEELEAFHDEDYVDFLARVTPDNVRHFTSVLSRFNIGDDCPIFSDMYSYCRQYAGASLMAARKIVSGSTDIAVNWTGGLHHAKKSEASGFCYVNDIVLAILELLRTHARVLYIDIDIHHGDGVQEAFYNTNRVLTNFSLNVPLQDGIDNESYVALFKAIMEPTIHTFRPDAIVLQCGADSLGCDRLGCFNLSIAAHGECVRFIKSFALPLVVLGGGGYTIKNVSRCWAYETAVCLGVEQDLPNALPHTAYDDFFAPDWKLHPELASGRNRLENLNSRRQLERIRVACLERLRYMHGAPSVQMHEVPPSLAQWLADEDGRDEQRERDEDGAHAPDGRSDAHRAANDYFSHDGDREGDAVGGRTSSSGLAGGSGAPPPTPAATSSTTTTTAGASLATTAGSKKRRKVAAAGAAGGAGSSAAGGGVKPVRIEAGGAEDEA